MAAMRSRAELDFIRDRVLSEIAANPPEGPLLSEVYPAPSHPKTTTCKAGHTRTPGRKCPRCAADVVSTVRERVWPELGQGEGY